MSDNRPARLGYADCLRCLACAAVVVLHATGGAVAAWEVGGGPWLALTALSALTRWSVPVFVMLSGAFLLDPDRPMPAEKWRGRVVRLALLTALAAALFALWDARGAHGGAEWFLEGLIRFVRGDLHYHLWFLPMLLGLYLLTPLLRALVAGASRRTLWYAIGLWAVFSLGLPFLCRFLPADLGTPWLERMELFGVLGYTGYYLLGYMLKTCEMRPRACLGLWLAGGGALAVTFWATVALSRARGAFDPRFFSYFSPFVALTAAGLFLAFRRLDWGKSPIWARLARCTLWVYLLHPLVLEVIF